MHEFILSKIEERNFCQVLGTGNSSFHMTSRHLSINHCRKIFLIWDSHSQENMLNVFPRYKYPHSIIFFDTDERNQTGEDIGNFLHKGIASGYFLRLQILDFENIYQLQLPKNVGDLINLMYLGLRQTFLESIPVTIDKLSRLQTLDLKHTKIKTLPSSIWRLRELETYT